MLSQFGLMSGLNHLIAHGEWSQFFNIQEPTLTPIVHEMLATLSVKSLRSWTDKLITFQDFGKEYKLYVNDLEVKMGFYKRQETMTVEFHIRLANIKDISVDDF